MTRAAHQVLCAARVSHCCPVTHLAYAVGVASATSGARGTVRKHGERRSTGGGALVSPRTFDQQRKQRGSSAGVHDSERAQRNGPDGRFFLLLAMVINITFQ